MAENAGFNAVLKISGTATAMVGEATTEDVTTKIYQISNAAKQVLERTGTIRVHKKTTGATAEAGTNTTTIHYTSHGLVVGDLICNETRSNAFRLVLTKNNDDFTVSTVTGQTDGDTIMRYPTEAPTAYSLNRLNGKVTYANAASRVIKVSGNYLPMSVAAYCNSMSDTKSCEILDISKFGTQYKSKMPGQLSASGTLTQLNMADTVYSAALVAGLPVIVEMRTTSTDQPNRYWALFDNDEITAAVAGVQNETVSWASTDEWLRLGL